MGLKGIKMVDIHTHILPELDDGSRMLADSLEMAEIAVNSGVNILVATPHSNQQGRFENYFSPHLVERFHEMQTALERENIPLTLLLGMEIFASDDLREKIKRRRLIGLNDTQYFLVEFPFDAPPGYIAMCLDSILDEGKVPVIAHPERYYCAQQSPELVYDWLQMGCLTQINKGSLFGRFGRGEQRLAEMMLEYDLATCAATDAHSSQARTTFMGDAKEYLDGTYGAETTQRLLTDNPLRILQGLPVPSHGTRPERRRGFFR